MTTADPIAAAGLTAVVAHARAVPSGTRDAFRTAALAAGDDSRQIVLGTCHRIEVYPVDGTAEEGPAGVPPIPEGARRLRGVHAARHLMRVAAGLDSVVIGEDQILHQLRECVGERR